MLRKEKMVGDVPPESVGSYLRSQQLAACSHQVPPQKARNVHRKIIVE